MSLFTTVISSILALPPSKSVSLSDISRSKQNYKNAPIAISATPAAIPRAIAAFGAVFCLSGTAQPVWTFNRAGKAPLDGSTTLPFDFTLPATPDPPNSQDWPNAA
jgi:hypothetical protein